MKSVLNLAAIALAATLLLAGCETGSANNSNNTAGAKTNAVTTQKPADQVSLADVKSGVHKMLTLSEQLKTQLSQKDTAGARATVAQVEHAWYQFENRVHVDYPLQYNDVEKYWMPLTAGAKSDHFDAGALSKLNDGMAAALKKLQAAIQQHNTARAANTGALTQAVDNYKKYVEQQVNLLIQHTRPFAEAVEAGDITKAKQLYPQARVYYERIEPIAESFGDLDPRIDARANDVTGADKWTGFHEIEQALWVKHSLAGQAEYAKQLLADEQELQQKVRAVQLRPEQVIAGSVELLNEAATSKVTGEEERYSHVDLVDLNANVEGSQEAFTVVEPALKAKDPNLAKTIEQRFQTISATLKGYRVGDGFKLYTQLSTADTRKISEELSGVAEPLSKAAKLLG
jgi:iron uptake system component EfeO